MQENQWAMEKGKKPMKTWIEYRMVEVAEKSYNTQPWHLRYDDWLCSMATGMVILEGAMDIVDQVEEGFIHEKML